uniref:Uncharacterized protein n=1 Tax=Magallana gigas TaxID=29159 RepID=K1PKB5_MAGGI
MSANILAVLLVFGCGLIHLVTGQCIVVKKSEEKVEEAKSDVWLPNLFHDWISGCEYKGVQMKPGNEVIFPFPDCTVCVCTDKSRVICCRNDVCILFVNCRPRNKPRENCQNELRHAGMII